MKSSDTRAAEPALLALAREAGALKLRSLPPEVLRQARQCTLDTLGCILAGSRTEEARLVLEMNDLIGGHASIGIVTVALGLAEAGDATLGETLEAVVCGIEVTARVYGAVYPSLKRFSDSAMVPVGIPSSIGAAAAASRLSILDTAQTAHAMRRIDAPRGSPERPLSEHDVVEKFRRLAVPVIGPERADRIAAQVMDSGLHAPVRGWLADLRRDG